MKLYRARLIAPERLAQALGRTMEEVIERFGQPDAAATDADSLLAELRGAGD